MSSATVRSSTCIRLQNDSIIELTPAAKRRIRGVRFLIDSATGSGSALAVVEDLGRGRPVTPAMAARSKRTPKAVTPEAGSQGDAG